VKSWARIWRSAVCELGSAIRTRRALVVLVLYLAASLLTMYSSISILGKMETQLAETLQLPQSGKGKSGVVSTALWKSRPFQRLVKAVVNDDLVYNDVSGLHPAELIYACFAFFYVPLLTILIGANRVADDLHSGAVRYMITRVTRFEWSLGKYVGNALLMLPAMLAGALAAWIVAAIRLSGADSFSLLPPMLVWATKGWMLSLAYLGIALGISHLTHSGAKATALGVISLIVCFTVPKVLSHYFPSTAETLNIMFPATAEHSLWRASFKPVGCTAVWLLALGLTYLTAGYAFFARRDAR